MPDEHEKRREESLFQVDVVLEFLVSWPIGRAVRRKGGAAIGELKWGTAKGYGAAFDLRCRRANLSLALNLSPPRLGRPRDPLICAVGTPGSRLGRRAAGQCDCLIWRPLKASWSYCVLACQCWAFPEESPLGRRCPVFVSWPLRTPPLAGPETWPAE